MKYAFLEPWSAFLPREAGHVLSFSGSGGKTSLMQAVAGHYTDSGLAVVVTTTTRSEPIAGIPQIPWNSLPAGETLPAAVFIHAGSDPSGKLTGLAPDQVDDLRARLPHRIILCEVDGAAKLPLKLYRAGEPCWPGATSLALVVMGAAAVGSRADAMVHRLGQAGVAPAEAAALPGHTVLQWAHMEDLLLGEGGYLARVPQAVPVVLALGQMDQVADSIGLFAFAGRAMEDPRLPLLVFSGRTDQGRLLRTAYRCAEERGISG